jgi:hypothetical protein
MVCVALRDAVVVNDGLAEVDEILRWYWSGEDIAEL